MRRELVWTDSAKDHIAQHGVTSEEVYSVIASKQYQRKVGDGATIIGRTDGKVLFVVVRKATHDGRTFEIVTARPATFSEKHLLRHRGRRVR